MDGLWNNSCDVYSQPVLIFLTLLQGYLVAFEERLIKTVGETSNIGAYI